MNNVKVSLVNSGGGTLVYVAPSSVATNTFAAYVTTVVAETTAPPVTGSYVNTVSLGNLASGQVKAFWLKRTLGSKTSPVSADRIDLVVSADEVIPEGVV
jgi:hypothetical protein